VSDPIQDVLIDLPKLIAVYGAIKAAKATLPSPAKAVDYAVALGCGTNSIGYQVADLIDTIEGQVKNP
jgi:hypothetical protein